ncbi:MAG: DUF523 domain-containing protein [archaeon]|nr:MAG: DUF523 domain-containing protein [archaeon]
MKDKRSRKIAFLAHCLINQNSKVQGVANFPAMIDPLINLLKKHKIGIIQIPCPEQAELGIGRPLGDDTKQRYDTLSYRKTCSKISDDLIKKIKDYQKNNYKITFILGVNGSPSCGVDVTPVRKGSISVLSKEKGVFFEILIKKLGKNKIKIPIFGIPETRKVGNLKETLKKIEKIV